MPLYYSGNHYPGWNANPANPIPHRFNASRYTWQFTAPTFSPPSEFTNVRESFSSALAAAEAFSGQSMVPIGWNRDGFADEEDEATWIRPGLTSLASEFGFEPARVGPIHFRVRRLYLLPSAINSNVVYSPTQPYVTFSESCTVTEGNATRWFLARSLYGSPLEIGSQAFGSINVSTDCGDGRRTYRVDHMWLNVRQISGPPIDGRNWEPYSGALTLAKCLLAADSTFPSGTVRSAVGLAVLEGDPRYNDQSFWEEQYAQAVADGLMNPGMTYDVEYPQAFSLAASTGWQTDEEPIQEGLGCDPVDLDRLVYDISRRAGVPPHRIDVSGLTGDLFGYGIGRPASGRQQIELLQQYGFFDATDYQGVLRFRMRDRTPDGTIGGEDLAAHVFGEQRPSAAERTRSEDYELAREVRVQYLQTEAEFEPGMQLYERRLTDAQGVADIDLTAIAMSADKAASIAEISMLEAIVAREEVDFSLVATDSNKALIPSDIKTLDVDGETQTVRLAQLDYAWPGVQAWKAVRHDPSIYASDAVGISSRLPRNPIVVPGETTLELLDAPLVRLVDDVSGYFAAMGGTPTIPGIIEGWPGGDLFRQEPEGLEDIARLTRPGSYFGSSVNDPGEAPFTIRTAGPLIVTSSGPLVSISLDALLLGGNLAALEVRDGDRIGWEIIQYQDAERDEVTGQWTLTNLLRGRFGTEWAIGLHSAGDRFVTLPNVAQILTETDELSLERSHRAATIGRDPENADPVDFAWEGVDRIPYAPVHLVAEREDNDDLTLTWTRRDRVGREMVSGQTLPLSESSEAYEVDIYDTDGTTVLRTLQVSAPTATYTDVQQTTDFGSLPTELDWDVRQMGALGRGYAGRIESEGL